MGASVATVNNATEIRLLAERQMGEFLKAMPKATGAKGIGPIAVVDSDRNEQPATLREIGITKDQSSRAQKLAAIPEPEFRERIAVAKCDGGKLSTAKVLDLCPAAKRAAEEAEADSENLWKLKSLWNKTNKRDRAAFIAWTNKQ